MLAWLPLAASCCVDPDSPNRATAFACGRSYEAALCLEQKTADYELIIVDRRGAKHCGPGSIFRIVREKRMQGGEMREIKRRKEKGGWREGGGRKLGKIWLEGRRE